MKWLRTGLVAVVATWWLTLADVWMGGTFERSHLALPVLAVVLYGVYLLAAVVQRGTVWRETLLVGLALVPSIAGIAVAVLAAGWGGVRWLRSRRHVRYAT